MHFNRAQTQSETEILRSQLRASSGGYGGRRYSPLVFTEHGAELIEKYVQRSSSQLISQKIISRYADILLKINKFKVLN